MNNQNTEIKEDETGSASAVERLVIRELAWIPFGERMPEFDTEVFVWHTSRERVDVRYIPKDRPSSLYPGGSSIGWYSHWAEINSPVDV